MAIRVTTEELRAQGGDLVSLAGDLTEILTKVNNKVAEIEGAWDGMAQEGFSELYQNMKESLDQFPGLVDAIGKAASAAADAFEQVDTELKSQFTQLG